MIDAHHHLWDPARGDYGWMDPENRILSQVYAPADLAPQLGQAGVTRTVLVQAAPTVAETDYLLELAEETPWIAGVVGWIDFDDPAMHATLVRLAQHPKFLGVRPMIQDIPDADWMLGTDIAWAFEAVQDLGLTFDGLGYPRHAVAFAALCDRYPNLRIVLDHGLKPQIAQGMSAFDDWAENITRLAATQAVCKMSGLVTEAGEGWTVEMLRPWTDHLLNAFGPERVMWGSDWPVLRLCGEYADWAAAAQELTAHLSEADQAQVFGGTAARFYGLPDA